MRKYTRNQVIILFLSLGVVFSWTSLLGMMTSSSNFSEAAIGGLVDAIGLDRSAGMPMSAFFSAAITFVYLWVILAFTHAVKRKRSEKETANAGKNEKREFEQV